MTRPPTTTTGYSLRGRQGVVIEAVGRAIVGGRYEPGAVLPREDDLSEQYGVSRTTVRGAMTVLAAKGMLDIRPKTGTKVRARSLWSSFDSDILAWSHAEGRAGDLMEALIELRQVMEPTAARLAASRATMTDLVPLKAAADAMAASIGDAVAYPEWDVAFHQAVYSASHNPLLESFGMLVSSFMRIAFEIQHTDTRDRAELIDDAARHLDVYEAITRGDSERAASAMLEVVLDGKSALATALAEHAARPNA